MGGSLSLPHSRMSCPLALLPTDFWFQSLREQNHTADTVRLPHQKFSRLGIIPLHSPSVSTFPSKMQASQARAIRFYLLFRAEEKRMVSSTHSRCTMKMMDKWIMLGPYSERTNTSRSHPDSSHASNASLDCLRELLVVCSSILTGFIHTQKFTHVKNVQNWGG